MTGRPIRHCTIKLIFRLSGRKRIIKINRDHSKVTRRYNLRASFLLPVMEMDTIKISRQKSSAIYSKKSALKAGSSGALTTCSSKSLRVAEHAKNWRQCQQL